MKLENLKENWNSFGKVNPQWAILNEKGKKVSIKEFFKTGKKEISDVINYLSSKKITLGKDKALDFGCGIGRLTRALAPYFKRVYGVDISPSMIGLANKHNRYPNKCEYILNDKDNLSIFKDNSFDFIYTNITLQHMEPKYFLAYIKEFLRILKPKGILIFQLPSKRKLSWKTIIEIIFPKSVIHSVMRRVYGAIMEMHTYDKNKMIKFLIHNNAKVLGVINNNAAGKRFVSFKYCVKKKNEK